MTRRTARSSTSTTATPLAYAVRSTYPALAFTFIMSLFINLTMLVSPLYSMQIYDRVLSSRNINTLLLLTLIVVAFLVLYGILEYARSGVLVRAGMQFEERLRKPLFETMFRAEVMPEQVAGQQVIRDADSIRESLANGTVATLFDLPWAPVFIMLCFFLHPLLGTVAVVGALLLFSIALLTEFLTRAKVQETTRLSNEAIGFATSALRNGEVVRGLGMGDTIMERWSGQQSAAIQAAATAHERSAALNALTKFIRLAVQTSLLCAGAWLAIEREISPGAMLAASIIMGRALAPVERTIAQWKRIVAVRGSYDRLEKLFASKPLLASPTDLPVPEGRIDVENVVVWPPASSRPSVKGVSFGLEPGESLAIIGASGSGKSTLARALAGVWSVGNGVIRIDGAAYTQWDTNKLGKHIGYLPQDVELFAGTVSENIARLAKVDDAAVVAAAKTAGAHETILRLPAGYDTPIGDGGVALSGGMRQRVGLARALYGDPRLIILDEPNSNLDEEGERALAKAVTAMKEAGRSVVLVTHRPQIVNYVDKVLVMSFGKSIFFGPREEMVAKIRGNRVALAAEGPNKPRPARPHATPYDNIKPGATSRPVPPLQTQSGAKQASQACA